MMDEAAVIGCALLAPKTLERSGHLNEADFVGAGHALIWGAIMRLHAAGKPVDPTTVTTELANCGELERACFGQRLGEFIDGPFLPINIDAYVQSVIDQAARRKMDGVGRWLIQDAASGTPAALLVEKAVEQLSAVREGMVTNRRPARSYTALLSGEDDYDWIVPDLLERGDRLMITGREGLGKSTLIRQLAVSIAAGLHPFYHDPIGPSRVLVVDCENSDKLNRRMYRPLTNRAHIVLGANIPADMLLIESRVDGLDLTGSSDTAWLLDLVATAQPDVLIIGPLYKMHDDDPVKEEPARKVVAVLDKVRSMGAAIIIEAHAPHDTGFGKSPIRPYGASLWMRWPEFGYGIRAQEDPDFVEFTAWRGPRDERSWPDTLIRGGHDNWPWRVVDELDQELRGGGWRRLA